MDKQAQIITIAKACDWTPIDMGSLPTAWKHPSTPKKTDVGPKDAVNSLYLPDYLNDLNAMYEAEKVLSAEQRAHYNGWVSGICVDNYPIMATAAQRAEAFLKTLNLWKSS